VQCATGGHIITSSCVILLSILKLLRHFWNQAFFYIVYMINIHVCNRGNSHPLRYLKLCVTFWNISIVQIHYTRISKHNKNWPPTFSRIDTRHVGHAKIEVSQRIRTRNRGGAIYSEWGQLIFTKFFIFLYFYIIFI
jgi:hypothetical protein